MGTANDMQVAGDHYRSAVQHWDMVELHGVGYLEGQATKYVTRWRKKNGVEDLRKAVHYGTKLRELHASHARCNRSKGVSLTSVREFAEANDLKLEEMMICYLFFSWQDDSDLEMALALLNGLIDKVTQPKVG